METLQSMRHNSLDTNLLPIEITSTNTIKDQNYDELKNKLIEIFKTNLKNLIF